MTAADPVAREPADCGHAAPVAPGGPALYGGEIPDISYLAGDPYGTVRLSKDAHRRVYAASTIKIGVMIAAFRRIAQGLLDPARSLTVATRFASRADGRDYTFEDFGIDQDDELRARWDRLSVAQTIRRMITVSSNEATNMLCELIGLDAVNDVFRSLDLPDTRMERMVGDLRAEQRGMSNMTTAADLWRLMSAIVTDQAAPAEACTAMRALLRDQRVPIVNGVPLAPVWGSKSGWNERLLHDVAFLSEVEPPSAGTLVVAVCTRGFERPSGEVCVQALGGALWDTYRVLRERGIR